MIHSLANKQRLVNQLLILFFIVFSVSLCTHLANKNQGNTKQKSSNQHQNSKPNSNQKKSPKGQERAKKFGSQWQKADLNQIKQKFIGQNPKIVTTPTGKTIYLNQKTGIQIVVDNAGKYFRIQNTNLTGKRCYLDLAGKIPNNKVVNGKIRGNSQAEYNQLTHFLF